jgi:hypothetical protein
MALLTRERGLELSEMLINEPDMDGPQRTSMLVELLGLARDDATFMSEVAALLGGCDLSAPRNQERASGIWGSRHHLWKAANGMATSNLTESALLVAVLLWFRASSVTLSVSSSVEVDKVEGLLRAGRHCVTALVVDGTSAGVPRGPPGLPSLAHMPQLSQVTARFMPPLLPAAQSLVAELSRRAPSQLERLELSWAPPHLAAELPAEFGAWAGADERWDAPLPASLRHLSVEEASFMLRCGLADAVAACPALISLKIGGSETAGEEEVLQFDSPAVLRALTLQHPGAPPPHTHLHSLVLSDVFLSPELARAVGGLPALRELSLSGVYTLAKDGQEMTEALRSMGSSLRRLRSLSVNESLFRDEAELAPLLQGLALCGGGKARGAGVSLSSLRLHLPTHSPSLPFSSAALAGLLASAPIADLRLTHKGLSADFAGGPVSLRSLQLGVLNLAEPGVLGRVAAGLSACRGLERLSLSMLDRLSHHISTDGILAVLLGALTPHCLDLERLEIGPPVGYGALSQARAHLFPQSAAALAALHRRRQREASAGPAWCVVMAGVLAAQERRVRCVAGSLPPSPPPGTSMLQRMPASVLRAVGSYLPHRAVPLLVV